MTRTITQVDAFTSKPFAGNPAAVCLLSEEVPARWMQDLATEMNLPETAFVRRDGAVHHLRWFTPTVEVALCGHATLASAHTLWELGLIPQTETIRFSTLSGELKARRGDGLIWLDMPARSTEAQAAPDAVRAALGSIPIWEGRAGEDIVVQLSSEEDVRQLKPEMELLRGAVEHGLIVTAAALTPGLDFVSRYFAPGVGIDEDPVTGSAHCALGPFWVSRLGKTAFHAHQASRRGGDLVVRVEGARVMLGGEAVTVFRGELH